MTADADRDQCRREVAARGLTPTAVAHLTRDAFGRIDLAHLAPVKALLKRFFSDGPWSADNDDALAELVGPGTGWWSHALDDDIGLEFGWRADAFRLALSRRALLGETFDGSVVPEATPNPRTIRFVTGAIHDGPSRWYPSVEGVDDPRVAQLFADFDAVANVLVGPDFVAIGLRRPDRWEELLVPVLRLVAAQFAPTAPAPAPDDTSGAAPASTHTRSPDERGGAVERAWRQLGHLRPERPRDLREILDARSSPDGATRQVAARLLVGADFDVAAAAWDGLLDDASRGVRRATVDAMVDADRPALRPLLERVLRDSDAWTRWKALRGLVELGVESSRPAVAPLAEDPDFRVRLEVARALRARHGD